VGLAGAIAEYLDKRPELDASGIDDDLRARKPRKSLVRLSRTDAKRARGFGVGDVERPLALVKRLWSAIEEKASEVAASVDTKQ
jgi:hypothetical protein